MRLAQTLMPYRLARDQADTWLLAFSPIPTGLIMALFNDRFTSSAWRFAGGIPYSLWSGILLVCGTAMLICLVGPRSQRKHAILVGAMFITAVWWFSLGLMFLITSILDRLANPLGVSAWWLIAGLYGVWVWYERRQVQ